MSWSSKIRKIISTLDLILYAYSTFENHNLDIVKITEENHLKEIINHFNDFALLGR